MSISDLAAMMDDLAKKYNGKVSGGGPDWLGYSFRSASLAADFLKAAKDAGYSPEPGNDKKFVSIDLNKAPSIKEA